MLFQVHFRYPQKNLNGKAIKSTIAEHLVTPVLAYGDQVHAFRVIWRINDDLGLAQMWDAITASRALCDDIIAKTPALQMFVSCISGVFTNAVVAAAGRGATQEKPVYPAISYWVVFDTGAADNFGELSSRISAAFPSAQVKRIQSLRGSLSEEPLGVACGKLFVTLKDHNSGFVNQRINRSLMATGADESHPQPANAKLGMISTSKYIQRVASAMDAMTTSGLCIHYELLE